MKKLIAIAALLAATVTPAQAADWATGKGDRWTGAYIGAIGAGTGGTVETYWEKRRLVPSNGRRNHRLQLPDG